MNGDDLNELKMNVTYKILRMKFIYQNQINTLWYRRGKAFENTD